MNCDRKCRSGLCCTYMILHIPKKTDKVWLLYHKIKIVGKSDLKDHIRIRVDIPCKHLNKYKLCKIYDRRPKVCVDAECPL